MRPRFPHEQGLLPRVTLSSMGSMASPCAAGGVTLTARLERLVLPAVAAVPIGEVGPPLPQRRGEHSQQHSIRAAGNSCLPPIPALAVLLR
jgi:hypothetical protein